MCKKCGCPFTPLNRKNIYCSLDECVKLRHRSIIQYELTCSRDECKEKFSSKNKLKQFCSKSCKKKQMSEIMTGRIITWGDKITQASKGKPHPSSRKNFHHTEETKELLRQHSIEQMKDPEMRKLISIRTSEGQMGHKTSEATKAKIGAKNRIHHLNRIQNTLSLGDQLTPNYNTNGCNYFKKFDEENNTSGKHAMNGGELHVKELGYFLDYINYDLKIIIEWDEKRHYDVYGNLKQQDVIRQQKIQEVFPEYKFIRIKEGDYQNDNGN
jgi:hypothetical protein